MTKRKNILKAGIILIGISLVFSTIIVTGNTVYTNSEEKDPVNTNSEGKGGPWYVDANWGSDSNSGTSWGQAFKTISKAVSVCTLNDFIYVLNGTYFESVHIIFPTGITIIAVMGPYCTFVEGGSSNDAFYVRSEGVRIENFTIQNSWRGVYIHDSDNNTIIGNVIKNNREGIDIDGFWNSVTKNNTIEKNTINANTLAGIVLWAYCNNTLIRNNRITSNNNVNYGGVYIDSTSHNNLIYNNYFNNFPQDAWDAGTNNHWNIDPITYSSGLNICGGVGIGGNRWYGTPQFNKDCSNIFPPHTIPGPAGSADIHPIPGFELLVFIAAFAIVLMILRKRKSK